MSLRGQVLHSLKWLTAARFVGQAFAWATTLVVIRLLDPSDYGLMAMATIIVGFASLFRELGLYTAIVQSPNLTDRHVEQSFGLLILVNSSLYGLLLLIAPWVAAFFGDPRLTEIIWVLGLQFPLAAVGVVQDAMLSRRMAFKGKSFANLAAMLSNSAVTLSLALSGFGVWALVWGSLTWSIVLSTGLVVAARHWCRPRFSQVGMRELVQFGSFVTVTRVLWYAYQQADKLIIGKVLGKEALGQYAVAMQLASMPLQKFSSLMNQVGLAAYSMVQADRSAIRFYYCKAVRMVAFFSFPVFWGISSISPELVNVVLGETWQPAILPLAILSLIMPTRMIASAGSAAFEGIGKPQIAAGNVLITFLVMLPAFLIGVQWGLVGVSLAWLVTFPPLFLVRLHRSLPAIGVSMRQYFSSIAGPATGAIAMFVAVALTRVTIVDPYLPPVAGLAFLIIVGALCYALFMWIFQRGTCREVLRLVSQKKQTRDPA